MQALLFYLTYPLIYAIALLPFSFLYKVSDFFYFILKLSGYRRKVVMSNLKNSFPGKSENELNKLMESFYRYLCDLFLETFKTIKMTEKEAKERCYFHTTPWLESLYAEKKSILVVMGHYGNWEWAGPSFTLSTPYQLIVIYRPLSNRYFEKMMSGMRTKFGTKITEVNQTLRDMVANRSKVVTATAFIADQSATSDGAYWTNFLNQDTAVFTGPDKLSKKFDYPVVFMNVKRIKRGYYEVFPELLVEKPKETKENEIAELFTRRLEKEIQSDPTIWLWSHRRWKHSRPSNVIGNIVLF